MLQFREQSTQDNSNTHAIACVSEGSSHQKSLCFVTQFIDAHPRSEQAPIVNFISKALRIKIAAFSGTLGNACDSVRVFREFMTAMRQSENASDTSVTPSSTTTIMQ